jgi:hypothetical protein
MHEDEHGKDIRDDDLPEGTIPIKPAPAWAMLREKFIANPIDIDEFVDECSKHPGAVFDSGALEWLAEIQRRQAYDFQKLRKRLKQAIPDLHLRTFDQHVAAASKTSRKRERAARNPTQADTLIKLAQTAELFRTPDGIGYADSTIDGHRQTWPIRSKTFRQWLGREFFTTTEGAPNSDAFAAALNVIEARAHFEAPIRHVHLRVAGLDGKLYLDLCDQAWRAVEIDATGWRIITEVPVRFRRARGMLALPDPVAGGSLATLHKFLNVRHEADLDLVDAHLQASLRDGPNYPVLVLAGEHGVAKTFACKILRAVIDPNTLRTRGPPRDLRDLAVQAGNNHVLPFDNLSTLPDWLSDALARLSSGAGFGTRLLYSDDDEMLFAGSRPLIINSIAEIVGRADLADRCVTLMLERIDDSDRRAEEEMLAEFEAARPGILGGLLDTVSRGLRRLPLTTLDALPRMADFALWATACERENGTFMAAYGGNRADAVATIIEDDAIAQAVRRFLELPKDDKSTTPRQQWEGTATELLTELNNVASERATKAKDWPASPNALSSRLRRAAPALRKVEVYVDFDRSDDKKRTRMIYLSTDKPRDKPRKQPTLFEGQGQDAPAGSAAASASVPFMITAAMKAKLRARGYTDEAIRNLTPQQGAPAHRWLAARPAGP